MKRVLVIAVFSLLAMTTASAQGVEYKIITSIESIIPGGLGRSRLIENQDHRNADSFKTKRTDGKTSGQGKIRRKDAKVKEFSETKLLNFYSLVGINFQNIASNDALVGSTLNKLANEGWELAFVTSAVESDGGETDGNGIFITRYVFKRAKPSL
ncbi:hypothetical protein FUAX_04800 [Fulvitalea axinellae]|uniref:DUF4177 domain-containing protein n=1 Tax=Fulvitalea axinellae TaxID=1182444 RepID=A0AAU9CWT3_9BACT|nr:hypothetical protein FUAX_04800 [Fulvitalea axinellae]